METLILGISLAAWAGLHSWLASSQAKEAARARFGGLADRAYRLTYNVISAITLAPIAWLMHVLPDSQVYAVPGTWALVFMAGRGLALILLLAALLQTDILHFAGFSQLLARNTRSRMVKAGFYGLVRHPLYLFGLLVLWLSPSMTSNQLTASIVLTAYLFIGAVLEERRLLLEFGKQYETYRIRTPMILPRLRLRRPK
jgi:protein-S-isoprenylcysteine O-methyltransferase Ste14